jgi:hypothetical protein
MVVAEDMDDECDVIEPRVGGRFCIAGQERKGFGVRFLGGK